MADQRSVAFLIPRVAEARSQWTITLVMEPRFPHVSYLLFLFHALSNFCFMQLNNFCATWAEQVSVSCTETNLPLLEIMVRKLNVVLADSFPEHQQRMSVFVWCLQVLRTTCQHRFRRIRLHLLQKCYRACGRTLGRQVSSKFRNNG